LRALLAAAGASQAVVEGLTGPDRALLYAVAMTTGFCASELASLAPDSFDLDADPPTVTVKAAYSKNRRTSVQPLPPDVALALRAYLDGRPAGAPVWPGDWHKDAAEMLRLDLAAAGIPYRDAEGRVADFHSLRHAYVTLLQRGGVHPKVAQELARHSDIRLTMNVYTHAHLHDLAGAVEGLPSLLPGGGAGEAQELAATGTDGPAEARAPDPRLTPDR
jgi:integrase